MRKIDTIAALIIGVFALVLVIYHFAGTIPEREKFDKNARYTIAKITKIKSPSRGSCRFYYSYRIKGKLYEGGSIISCHELHLYKHGRNVFIQFSKLNPQDNSALDREYLFAPDTMIPPEFGWEKLPKMKND